MDLGMFFN